MPYLNVAARELLGMTATSALSERVFSVAATICIALSQLKREANQWTLCITAIEIQHNHGHSAVAVKTSTL